MITKEQVKYALAGVMTSVALAAMTLPVAAASLDATTTAAFDTGVTDAKTEILSRLAANAGSLILISVGIGVLYLIIKLIRRAMGR